MMWATRLQGGGSDRSRPSASRASRQRRRDEPSAVARCVIPPVRRSQPKAPHRCCVGPRWMSLGENARASRSPPQSSAQSSLVAWRVRSTCCPNTSRNAERTASSIKSMRGMVGRPLTRSGVISLHGTASTIRTRSSSRDSGVRNGSRIHWNWTTTSPRVRTEKVNCSPSRPPSGLQEGRLQSIAGNDPRVPSRRLRCGQRRRHDPRGHGSRSSSRADLCGGLGSSRTSARSCCRGPAMGDVDRRVVHSAPAGVQAAARDPPSERTPPPCVQSSSRRSCHLWRPRRS